MITLRDYQEDYIRDVRVALSKYKRVLLQASTGAGKTIMFSYIASLADKKKSKVLILSSRTEILKQNGGALQKMGLDVDYISPKQRKIPTTNIVSGMAQTMLRRSEKEEWLKYIKSLDFLIIDECHEQVSDFIHDLISDKCFVLGVSATPRRYGKMKQLGSMYKAMVTGVTTKQLIDLEYLSKARHFSIAAPKLDVPIQNGDYNQKALATKFESKPRYVGVVEEYLRLTPHKKTICFCVSSKQAIGMTKEFNLRGISAKYVLSNTQEEDKELSGDRKQVMDDFKASKYEVLVNVGILTAGFDCPDVEVIIANFATISMTKWKQAIGRGARVTETKKEFTILDCGANYDKLGLYDFEPQWCVWHDVGSNGGIQNLKDCDTTKQDINGKIGCGQRVPASCKKCPACGYEFRTEKHEYQIRLEEITKDDEVVQDSIAKFAARKKLEGWNTNQILVQCCLRNPDEAKKCFMDAASTLQLNPKYWFFFKKKIWGKVKKKMDERETEIEQLKLL